MDPAAPAGSASTIVTRAAFDELLMTRNASSASILPTALAMTF
jgi:hypothetical protein